MCTYVSSVFNQWLDSREWFSVLVLKQKIHQSHVGQKISRYIHLTWGSAATKLSTVGEAGGTLDSNLEATRVKQALEKIVFSFPVCR